MFPCGYVLLNTMKNWRLLREQFHLKKDEKVSIRNYPHVNALSMIRMNRENGYNITP
jgi:hypothetical protein